MLCHFCGVDFALQSFHLAAFLVGREGDDK